MSTGLNPNHYSMLTAKEIKPCGWLRTQLRIQADGLSGNLDKVWSDIRDSAWIGGNRDGWERVPYWLDGFVPLAYLLEDGDLIRRAKNYIYAILDNQQPDGWIGPCTEEQRPSYDMWAVILICKTLTVYADCNKEDEERVLNAVEKALLQMNEHIAAYPISSWAHSRWFETLIPIYRIYERNSDDRLIQLANTLCKQGMDWKKVFADGLIKDQKDVWSFQTHVVNLSMVLKSASLMSRINGEDPDEFAIYALDMLEKYNGMANGHFTGDECLGGISPIRGTELCGVVEAMYSYENLLAVSGNPYWAERLEKLAFNALPATVSPDMWSHQYDQMTNQIKSIPIDEKHVPFGTNGRYSNIFGLEPNYGCCTANFSQGFPKFALSTFMRSENGLASLVIAPAKVNLKIKDADVECELQTEYPFRDTLKYIVKTDRPVTFALEIRIPSFAETAELDGENVECGKIHTVEREWNGTAEIDVKLNFVSKIVERPDDMVCVWRGPLLYSVAIKENWIINEYTSNDVERIYPYCDYSIYPESKWNYALRSDEFEVTEQSYNMPFSNVRPPLYMTAKMSEIDWGSDYGYCKKVPEDREPLTKPYDVMLIPYGCTNLRMTEVPYIK